MLNLLTLCESRENVAFTRERAERGYEVKGQSSKFVEFNTGIMTKYGQVIKSF